MEPRVDFSEAELSSFEESHPTLNIWKDALMFVWGRQCNLLACVASQSQGLSRPDLVVLSYHSDSDSDSDDFDYELSSWVYKFMIVTNLL